MTPPPLGPLLAVFFVTSFAQKLANNYEGLSKILVRTHLSESPEHGGLGLDALAAGAFLTAGGLGYYIKPLLGAVTDRLPVFGYRRKSWLVLSALGTALAWAWVVVGGGATAAGLLVAVMAVNLTITFADVVCDGLMVESGQQREASGAAPAGAGNRPLQSAQWAGAMTAMLLAAAAGGLLAQFSDLRTAALLSGGIPLVAAVAVAVLVHEKRVAWDWTVARPGFVAVGVAAAVGAAVLALKLLTGGVLREWEPLLSPAVVLAAVLSVARVPTTLLAPAAVVILWPSLPFKAESQYFFQYCTEDNGRLLAALDADPTVTPLVRQLVARLGLDAGAEGFGKVFYGSVFLSVELLAGLAGLVLVTAVGHRVRLGTLLAVTLVGWAVTLALYYGLTRGGSGHPAYLLLCGAGSGFCLWTGNLATLFYAASRVPTTHQATSFALLMGLSNLGGMFGVETAGGWLYTTFAAVPGQVGRDGDRGLVAVLAGLLRWLAGRGDLDPAGRPS